MFVARRDTEHTIKLIGTDKIRLEIKIHKEILAAPQRLNIKNPQNTVPASTVPKKLTQMGISKSGININSY